MTMKEFVQKYLKVDWINGEWLLPDARIGKEIYSVSFSAGTYADPKIRVLKIDNDDYCIYEGYVHECPLQIDRIEVVKTRWQR